MKILVLSDSHAGLSFMRECIYALRPDAVVHLGDYYDDGQVMAEENPGIYFYQVPGNCDANRGFIRDAQTRIEKVCGVKLYMTHGHCQRVKLGTYGLLLDARKSGVQAVLYGHTHQAECYQADDGLWVMNPGAGGSWGGSAGLIEAEQGEILGCKILRAEDLKVL